MEIFFSIGFLRQHDKTIATVLKYLIIMTDDEEQLLGDFSYGIVSVTKAEPRVNLRHIIDI